MVAFGRCAWAATLASWFYRELPVLHASPSLLEMGQSFGASRGQQLKLIRVSARPEILAGTSPLYAFLGVKGVVIGQLLVFIIGAGALFS